MSLNVTQANLTQAGSILKEFYEDTVAEQMNQATPLAAEIERDKRAWAGKELYVPVHSGRSDAVTALAETGTLPTPSAQAYDKALLNSKFQAGRIQFTVPVIKSATNDRASYVRIVESETKGMMTELKEDTDRQYATNTRVGEGFLASVSGASSNDGTTTTVPLTAEFAVRFKLRVGMVVDIINSGSSNAVTVSAVPITALTFSGTTVTEAKYLGASNPTLTSSHRIVRTGTSAGSAGGYELIGIPGIVDNAGTLHGINPATAGNEYWKATVTGNAGTPRPISDDVLQAAADLVWLEADTDSSDLAIVTNIFQRRKYAAGLTSQKRFTNSLDLKGGFTTITWNDSAPFLIDKYVNNTKAFMINRKHLKFYELADYEWMQDDGAVLNRVPNKMAYESTLIRFGELGTDKRNAHARVDDLSES